MPMIITSIDRLKFKLINQKIDDDRSWWLAEWFSFVSHAHDTNGFFCLKKMEKKHTQ